jgi:cardiolipin synthase A/B
MKEEAMTDLFCGPRGMSAADIMSRITGSPLIAGNSIQILRDGTENYPAWEAAISSARSAIDIEMYIIHNDTIGKRFRDLLAAKARQGVKIRILYDWFGSLRTILSRMWQPIIEAGGEVRAANPPSLAGLLGWISRDHRKLIVVDNSIAFIAGLCISDAWLGNEAKGIPPWRDVGVAIRGPSVVEAKAAFEDAWRLAGSPTPDDRPFNAGSSGKEGDVNLRIVATSPDMAGLYRLDLLMASVARDYLWLTDAYFLGTTPYIRALRSAAEDGVDVRLLVPHGSDIQWIANISRTIYRSLLESGVRVFEWNGPMMHAKTAVCDDHVARIGSSNLNISSWIGNWEMDVVIEDEMLARQMKDMLDNDYSNSTEIILTERKKVRPARPISHQGRHRLVSSGGKSFMAGIVKASGVLNSAMTGKRHLDRTESGSLLSISGLLLSVALASVFLPKAISYTVGFILAWTGAFLLVKGLRLRFKNSDPDDKDSEV